MRLPATSMDRVGDDGKRGEVENNAIASGKGRAAQWRQASAATRPAVGAGTRRWGREGGRGRREGHRLALHSRKPTGNVRPRGPEPGKHARYLATAEGTWKRSSLKRCGQVPAGASRRRERGRKAKRPTWGRKMHELVWHSNMCTW